MQGAAGTSGAAGMLAALDAMGLRPRDATLYERALRHRSTGRRESNERLEFLGDSVMATAVSGYLVRRYPGSDEGFLTRLRTNLVKGETQTMLARRLGLGGLVQLSAGAEEGGKRDDAAVLEDALEALVGAVYLDRGFDEAERWVTSLYERYLDFSEAVREETTSKERLQRVSRQRGDSLEFSHSRLIGDVHKVVVSKGARGSPVGVVVGVGEGPSKREATDEACRRGIRHYGLQ